MVYIGGGRLWCAGWVAFFTLQLILPAHTQLAHNPPHTRAWNQEDDGLTRRHQAGGTPTETSPRRAWWEDLSGRRQTHPSPTTTRNPARDGHRGSDRQNTAGHVTQHGRQDVVSNDSLHLDHQASRQTVRRQHISQRQQHHQQQQQQQQQHNLGTPRREQRQPQRRLEHYLAHRSHSSTRRQPLYPQRPDVTRQHEAHHDHGHTAPQRRTVDHTTSVSSHTTPSRQHTNTASTQHHKNSIPRHHTSSPNSERRPHHVEEKEEKKTPTTTEQEQGGSGNERRQKKLFTAHRPSRSSGGRQRPPNIVLIMTDDQDVELGSLNYMPSLMYQMKEQGAHFPNAYCSTPICCPSRSSMLTGLYIHNHEVYTNNHNCSSRQWQETHERRSFATYLRAAGYRTGYFGKYLNKYNGSHIPAGWQEWAGLIKNSRYYNYTIQRNGHFVKYGDQYPKDYYPHVITNEGIQFLEKNRALDPSPPMLTVLSYPAPHGPEDSAPEHAHRFFNATDHNTMAYNYAPNPDKQWLLQFIGRMHDIELKFTDLLMTKRLQTLQTVDEAVEKVINTLDALGELNNTYIFYTSDHGYHLGQFGLVKGKSMPFEFDIKVPFLVRGPGIRPGTQIDKIALNVDLAPTFLEIAGIKPPPHMDGRSLLPLLTGSGSETFPWRDNFLVESAGRHREEDALKLRQERRQHRAQGHIGTGSKGGLYTSKRERLEIICQSEEYRSPCKPEQKWECVRDEYSRWRLHKCRKSKVGGPSRTKWRQRKCVCEPDLGMGYLVKLDSAERRKQRTFLKKHTTQNLRNYGTKFIKVFSDVDSREILEQSIGLRVQRNSLFSHSRRIRSRRSTNLDLPLEDSNPVYEEDIDEDNVDTFVTEEEIRDLDVTINTLSDELENLESVSSTAATSVAGGNMSVLATSPTNATPADVRHGCRVTGTSVGCTDDVYRDPHAWKLSKVAINQQIRRLRHQLTVMKNIKKHLQDSRPDSVAESEDYEEYDETESSGDFNMIMGESDLLEPNDEDGTSTTEGSDSFQDLYGTQDTNNGYDDSMFNSSEHDSADYEVGHSGDDDDEDGPQGGEDSDDEGVIIIGNDYDVGGEVHQHGHHDDVDGNEEDRTLLEDSQPELPHILKIPGKNGQQGSKQFQLFPVRESSSHQRPPTIINETSARARCWCDKSFRLQIKQAERQKKREERLRLRLERQRVKQERRQQKEKKKLRKLKNNLAQCNYTMLNCYTHDNDHWRTPPLWHDGKFCFCMNAANNTYWCVRTINETHNFLYCEFVTGLVTYYDLNIDPYQLRNVAFTLTNKRLAELHHRLETLRTCSGAVQCDDLPHSQVNRNSRKYNEQDEIYSETDELSNRVNILVDSQPNKNQIHQREERRRLREDRFRQREERRRIRKEEKKWRRNQLYESKGRHILGTVGSERRVVRLPRKSRVQERKRLKKERRREKRRERKRRKKSKNDRMPLSG